MAAATITSKCFPSLEMPLIQINNIDRNDLPSTRTMDVDQDDDDLDLDEECSITSEPVELVKDCEDEVDEEVLARVIEEAVASLEDMEDTFNFLPDLETGDVFEGDASSGPSTASYQQMHHNLVDDNGQQCTWQWHKSAGKVYRHEKPVLDWWKVLFENKESKGDDRYQPFNS